MDIGTKDYYDQREKGLELDADQEKVDNLFEKNVLQTPPVHRNKLGISRSGR